MIAGHQHHRVLVLLACCVLPTIVLGFLPLASRHQCSHPTMVCHRGVSMSPPPTSSGPDAAAEDDEEDIEFLFEEEKVKYEDLDPKEKVWRYTKKPLLRIGSKGATHPHGNSLRQLLDDHTVVKVKFNLKKFGAFDTKE